MASIGDALLSAFGTKAGESSPERKERAQAKLQDDNELPELTHEQKVDLHILFSRNALSTTTRSLATLDADIVPKAEPTRLVFGLKSVFSSRSHISESSIVGELCLGTAASHRKLE